jgi:cellulose synthase/poly-beta-1,6-N-acetylglucosamine synthase-like glycosyltransferase
MIFFSIYLFVTFFISLFCINQFYLLILSFGPPRSTVQKGDTYPSVAIQLPVFNEKNVISRLIKSMAKLDYPKELLEIQILDDSDDETTQIAMELVAYYQNHGWNMTYLRRNSREGFKAGALQYGLQFVQSELIAIFDADFIPSPDFLKKNVGYFENKEIGVVQTSWVYINEMDSLLTKVQAFQLTIHFLVEQKGRFLGGYFSQFNGTSGIWRKTTILDAGGWQKDTLTEDLDLSIRAQLNGWKFIQVSDFGSPSELPSKWIDYKNQQFRWIKGGAQCWKKLIYRILLSDIGLKIKIQTIFQLSGSLIYVMILIMGLTSIGLIWMPTYDVSVFFSISQIGFLSLFFVYALPWIRVNGFSIVFFYKYLIFLVTTMGMSYSNANGAIQGLIGQYTPFLRTPKYGNSLNRSYNKINPSWIELCLAICFLGAILVSCYTSNFMFIFLHIFFFVGFTASFLFSVLPRHN